MGLLRAEFTSYFSDDLPRDMDVNTVYFRDSGQDGILEALGFVPSVAPDYNATALNWATAVHDFFANASIFQPGRGVKCKLYDMGATKPRPVLGQGDVGPTAARQSGSPGNPKVAFVVSFFGGRNLPRQRGRNYLGPLGAGAAGSFSPGSAERTQAINWCTRIAGLQLQVPNPGTNSDVDWVVYSPTSNSSHKVTDGWVDDEWDTVRKRGERATTRTTVTALQS